MIIGALTVNIDNKYSVISMYQFKLQTVIIILKWCFMPEIDKYLKNNKHLQRYSLWYHVYIYLIQKHLRFKKVWPGKVESYLEVNA